MERLTEWIDDGEHRQAIPKTDIRNNGHNKCCNKLAEYEDLEEQGLLVRLPCPIGATVWDICGMDIRENVVSGLEYDKGGKWFLWANEDECLGELNVLVFLNREEAEKKLEEIQNDKT